jgi:hypothetical protein
VCTVGGHPVQIPKASSKHTPMALSHVASVPAYVLDHSPVLAGHIQTYGPQGWAAHASPPLCSSDAYETFLIVAARHAHEPVILPESLVMSPMLYPYTVVANGGTVDDDKQLSFLTKTQAGMEALVGALSFANWAGHGRAVFVLATMLASASLNPTPAVDTFLGFEKESNDATNGDAASHAVTTPVH